jgi:hypothetical protein
MATAAEIINQIIANAIATANSSTEAATEAANTLISSRAGVYIAPPNSLSGFTVAAVEPEIPEAENSTLVYDAELAKIIALLSGQLADFFALYYPLASDAFDEATAWLVNTITNGGTGINATVEDQIWQRDRERITIDTLRVKNQIATGFAAKGYSMVAGAMLRKMEEADYEGAGKIGVSSTTVAAKQMDTEIAMIQFSVEQAIKSRSMAMNAAADYIRAVATGPAAAAHAAELNTDVKAKMMAAAASWYGARLDRDKIVLQSKLAEMGSRDDIFKLLKTNDTANSQVDVQALSAAVDVLAKTAQAYLLGLNSVVSTTASTFS